MRSLFMVVLVPLVCVATTGFAQIDSRNSWYTLLETVPRSAAFADDLSYQILPCRVDRNDFDSPRKEWNSP
jgi:hypothetical protein